MKKTKLFFLFVILSVIHILSVYSQSNIDKRFDGTIASPSQLLDGKKAVAQWIWAQGEANPRNQYVLVRRTYHFDQLPDSVTAYISAYTVSDIYVNGQLVDRCPMNCDPEYQVYEKFDLTRYFHQGENTLSAIVYNFGIGMHHRINARGGFFFQGKAYLAGQIVEMNTDNSWLVTTHQGWDNQTDFRTGTDKTAPNLIGFIEKFDARKMPDHWQNSHCDVSQWQQAQIIGTPPVAPWNQIVLVQRPALFREKVYPVDHWYVNGWVVYDFGKEVTGVPVIGLTALKEGIDITIGTAERLNPDRTADFKRRVNYEDHYITRLGEQKWNPFTWRGFRYVTFPVNSDIIIQELSMNNRHFAVRDDGSFECSDALLNRIWNVGRNTLKWCSQDTYMDTPWREQTQYIAGDSRFLLKYGFYASGMSSEFLTHYNILSGAWSQRWSPDGAIRSRYPTDWLLGEGTSGYLIDYEFEWVIMLGEYYQYFGNPELIRQVYPNLVKLMNHFETLIGKEHGVLSDIHGWVVLDHPDTYPMDQTKEITALNCLYYAALTQASHLANVIVNDPAQAKKWSTQAATLKKNIQRYFWSPEKKLYADSYGSKQFSQQTQVYALLYGLVPDTDRAGVIDYIASQNRYSEMSFAYYVVYSLFEQKEQWALDYIRKYWGDQMKLPSFNGGWQEGWNVEEWTDDIGSTSHAWCSGPTALLPQKVIGAEPITPGWKEYRIAPHPGDLTWAKGVIPAPVGNLDISWTRSGSQMTLTTVVPAGAKALISLPGSKLQVNGKPATDYPGIKMVPGEAGRVNIQVGAGTYEVTSEE